MKRRVALLFGAFAVFAMLGLSAGNADAAGKRISITGEVIDTWCYLTEIMVPEEMPTFEEAARTVIAIHRSGWRNAKQAAQWDSTLREYAFPRLGKRPVSDIDTKDVMAALLPIWTEKPETAKRVRQRIGTIMKWAIAQGHRTDNPAGEALGAALPKTDNGKRHHAALPHAKVADAIAAVQGSGAGMAVKLAFEFLVLTAARSGEIRLATWDEIDTDARTWTARQEKHDAFLRQFEDSKAVMKNVADKYPDGTTSADLRDLELLGTGKPPFRAGSLSAQRPVPELYIAH